MEWTEIITLILSAISVLFTAGIGVATIILNVKVSKINNIKDYKENNKHITPFELQFRAEEWLYDLIVNRDEFYKYDNSSQKRITKWFEGYAKTHTLTKLKVYNELTEKERKAKEKAEKEKTEQETVEEQETTDIGAVDVKVPRGMPSLGRGKRVKIVNTDPNLEAIAARIRLGASSSATLHEYPINDNTIHPTPIIIDLEDEFDKEDDKK